MMMRFWLLTLLLALVGCSSSDPPVTPPEKVATGDTDSTDSADESPDEVPEKEHVPTFTPTKTTPITTGPEDETPRDPDSESSQVELTEKLKSVVANLINPDPKVKDQAQIDLESTEYKPVDILIAAAKAQEPAVRAGAVYGLSGRFNQYNIQMMKVLRESLGDEDAKVRSLAVSAVSEMPAKLLVPALGHLAGIVSDPGEPAHVRAAAARLLGKISQTDVEGSTEEEQAREAFDALSKVLTSTTDRSIQLAALPGLVSLAPAPADAVLVLSKVLVESKDDTLRRRAATQLGDLGEESASAVPALITALDAKDDRVASEAADALVRIGSPAVPLLGEKAAQGEKPARLLAIKALAQLGPAANSSTVFLEQAAQDPDQEISKAAQAALRAINQ